MHRLSGGSDDSSEESVEPNVHLQYSDEIKLYNLSEVFEDVISDFKYIGNHRIVTSVGKNFTDGIYHDCDGFVADINTKEIIKKITFDQDYLNGLVTSFPEGYEDNGFLYISRNLYDICDNDGNFVKRLNIFENNTYSDYELQKINKYYNHSGHISINNNGNILYYYNNSIILKDIKTNETKTLFTDSEDDSYNYSFSFFIDENRFVYEKTTDPRTDYFYYQPYIYNRVLTRTEENL